MNIRRIILQTSCLATNYPCNELSGNELSMRRIVLATNCPATNCPATNCPCNELSATNCPQRIVRNELSGHPANKDLPINTDSISINEVKEAIQQLKNGKAPGLDHIITP